MGRREIGVGHYWQASQGCSGVALEDAVQLILQPIRSHVIQSGDGSSGGAVDAQHPMFEGPQVSVSVTARRRSPLHAPPNRIRELQ